MDNADNIAEGYIAAWNETDPEKRETLIARAFTKDATYVDPLAAASGHGELASLIAGVQQRFPGFRFALLGKADGYGERIRFSWTLGPEGQDDLIQGTDFALVDGDRLARVEGFLDKVPTAA